MTWVKHFIDISKKLIDAQNIEAAYRMLCGYAHPGFTNATPHLLATFRTGSLTPPPTQVMRNVALQLTLGSLVWASQALHVFTRDDALMALVQPVADRFGYVPLHRDRTPEVA